MSIARYCFDVSERSCLLVALISILLLPGPVRAQEYALVDLTAASEEAGGSAIDVNDDGFIVGRSLPCAVRWERHAGQWSQEALDTKLCLLPNSTFVNAVNSSEVAVGWWKPFNSTFILPVIWEAQEYEIPPGLLNALFYDVNNSGQIVGFQFGLGALFWEEGVVTHLSGVTAAGINDLAQVAGAVGTNAAPIAALWEKIEGKWEVTELGTLGGSIDL